MLLIGIDEIAKKYGVCSRVVSKWIQDGAPAMRIGKRVAVDDDKLKAWLMDHRPARGSQKTCQVHS